MGCQSAYLPNISGAERGFVTIIARGKKYFFFFFKPAAKRLTSRFILDIIIKHTNRGVEQLVARRAHNPEVVGSNPAPATIEKPSHIKALRL